MLPLIRDGAGDFARMYGADGSAVFVVRPDGYLWFSSSGIDTDGLAAHLARRSAQACRPRRRPPCGSFAAGWLRPEGGVAGGHRTFRPSIDWGHELVNSTLWVLETFAHHRVCLVVVLVLLGRFTEWGRQFWRITGDYFTGSGRACRCGLMLAVLLVSAVVSVRISVLLSYYANDLFTSLQVAFEGSGSAERRAEATPASTGSGSSMRIFAVLATLCTSSGPCSTST